MKQHRAALAGALAVTALMGAGCGSSDDDATTSTAAAPSTATSETTTAKTAPKVAYITTVFSDFQQAQEEGIEKVLSANGGSFKTFNANYDPQKLLSQCKDAVSSGRFNAILLQVLDPPTGVPCVQAAKAAGIPVVAVDSAIGTDPNSLEPQVDGVVGGVIALPSGNAESSVALVTKACEGIDPCKVIAEVATPTDPLTNQSVEAVKKGVPNAEVVGTFASGFDPGVVASKLPDLLSAHKDANVFLAIADGSALAAIPAVQQAGLTDQVKLIGKGGSRAGAAAIADGQLFASSGTWPRQEGEIVAEMAVKALNGEPIDPKGYAQLKIDQPELLDKSNVDQFSPEWGASR